MESLNEDHEFFELGDEICGTRPILAALEKYAEENAAFFPIG